MVVSELRTSQIGRWTDEVSVGPTSEQTNRWVTYLTLLPFLSSSGSVIERMKILIVLATVFLFAPASRSEDEEIVCDSELLSECLRTFVNETGLSVSSNWTVFSEEVSQFYATEGLYGFQNVCVSAVELELCLGAQYNACLSESYFESIGLSKFDAQNFELFEIQTAYQCSNGSNATVENWDCISEAYEQFDLYLFQCKDIYRVNVTLDLPNQCQYNQALSDCTNEAFRIGCGPDVYDLNCQMNQYSYGIVFPDCPPIKCQQSLA